MARAASCLDRRPAEATARWGWAVVLGSLAGSALSLAVFPADAGADPWTLWGDGAQGDAFKPLPVAVHGLLAPLGGAAPIGWALIVRAGAIAGLVLAFVLARQLIHGSWRAGLVAPALLIAGTAYFGYSTSGVVTGLLLALALAGVETWRRERHELAIGFGVACALLQIEAWPILLVAGVMVWRRWPDDRVWLLPSLATVPLFWLAPVLVGSG